MFIPLSQQPSTALRPADSSISPGDWNILADFWYPVATEQEIGTEPVRARLLDVELVLFRADDGTIAAMTNRCPHRQVRLSAGRVVDGHIECAFHGLRFDRMGQCRLVPALGSLAADRKLPPNYRVPAFTTRRRYGLVWLCLGDPARYDIPTFPDFDGIPERQLAVRAPRIWPVSAPRQVENFIDLAHLAFIHRNALGGDLDKPLKPATVEQTAEGIILHAEYLEKPAGGAPRPCQFTYRIVLPFTIDFTVRDESEHVLRSCDIPSPISAHASRVFQLFKLSAEQVTAQNAEALQSMFKMIEATNQEDIDILSELTSPDLPLDQHHEIHLPVDNVSGAYRKRLRELGLGQ